MRRTIPFEVSMRPPSSTFLSTLLVAAVAGGTATSQQATQPVWSTYFGGSNLDLGQAICRGPGNLITIAGTTMSSGLAYGPAVHQPAYGGSGDGFVARFDPSQPPGQQLLWCTYFGGSDLEIVFDVEVDAAGNVVFAGCTHSPGFTANGPGDGFVARLDGSNGSLMNFVRVGGTNYDRITDITPVAASRYAFVGVTDSTNYPTTPGAAFPSPLGGSSDSIAGCIDFAASPAVAWTTYLGGPGTDGYEMVSYLANGGLATVWPGDLKRQAVTTLPGGRIALVTANRLGAATFAGVHPVVYQTFNQGLADVYYVEFDAATGQLAHATLLGGSSSDFPMDIASHPTGGVVVVGATLSPNFPTSQNPLQATFTGSPTDGFVLHFDPSRLTGQVRYGSYVGGNGGEDMITRVAVDPSSCLVTLVGTAHGGGAVKFPTTRGALLSSALAGQRAGAIVRLRLDNTDRGDLVYGTLIGQGNTILHDVALDDVGDPIAVGGTYDANFPLQSAQQVTLAGLIDATITNLPMLPGGTERQEVDHAEPACTLRLHSAALGEPVAGNAHYTLCATNAPPGGIGVLAFGVPTPPATWLNVDVLVNPILVIGATAAQGFASHPLPIPLNLQPGFQTFTQWAFLTTPACPGSGPMATTERLQITTL